MKLSQPKKHTIFKTLSKYLFIFLIACSVLMPFALTHAIVPCTAPNTPAGCTPTADSSTPGKKPVDSSTPAKNADVTIDTKINNPIGKYPDLQSFMLGLLNVVLTVGVPIVALALIYCGFLFVKARGNSEEITKAKKALVYTIIGGVLLLGSWVLANAIQGTVDEIIRNS